MKNISIHYVGVELPTVGFGLLDWQCWFVLIPTVIFVSIFNQENKEQ